MKCFATVILLACLLFGCASIPGYPGGVSKRYDRFRDETIVTMEEHFIQATFTGDIKLSGVAISKGDGREKPVAIALGLVYVHPGRGEWSGASEITFLVDGKRVSAKKENYDFQIGQGIRESVFATLPVDEVVAMATAKKIEGQVGTTEFVLKPENLLSLRNFVAAF